jgi:hypothetical protein
VTFEVEPVNLTRVPMSRDHCAGLDPQQRTRPRLPGRKRRGLNDKPPSSGTHGTSEANVELDRTRSAGFMRRPVALEAPARWPHLSGPTRAA